MKRILSMVLVITTLFSCMVGISASASTTGEDTVIQAVGLLGIMNGDNSGDLKLGSQVTRAEFTKMVIAASSLRELTSATSASAPFPDVRSNHWAAGYVSAAVANGWVNGYLDGRFRPDNPVKMEEAVNIVLKLLGFQATDFAGTYPEAQINKYHALKLDENVNTVQGEYMTRRACMYLIYNALNATNKEGRVHCTTLGYSVDSDGKIDTVQLLNDTVEGPIIVTNSAWDRALSFDVSRATVFRNDAKSAASAIVFDDVVYYSAELRTLWVYSQKAHGRLEAASPNLIAPTSVTVSGKTYALSSAGSYALSNFGGYKIGDTVTLLLGKNGEVVGTASGTSATSEIYGVVVAIGTKDYTNSDGSEYSAKVVTVLDTSGTTGEYQYESKSLTVGTVVRLSVGADLKISALGSKSISGKVSALGTGIGTHKFADDVQILDVCEGKGVRVYPNRIAGMTLKTSDVIHYIMDTEGNITHLILDDVTGDLKQYGIITKVNRIEGMNSSSVSYEGVVNGQETVISNATASAEITTGGFSMMTTLEGKTKVENLKHITLSALTESSAQAGNTSYPVSDRVVVYELRNDKYYLSSVGAVTDGTFELVGYYDADGRIRVILAK